MPKKEPRPVEVIEAELAQLKAANAKRPDPYNIPRQLALKDELKMAHARAAEAAVEARQKERADFDSLRRAVRNKFPDDPQVTELCERLKTFVS